MTTNQEIKEKTQTRIQQLKERHDTLNQKQIQTVTKNIILDHYKNQKTTPTQIIETAEQYLPGLQELFVSSKKFVIETFKDAAHQLASEEKIKYTTSTENRNTEALETLGGKGSRTEKRNEASEILTETFLHEHYVHTVRDDTKTEMWIYQDGIYRENAKTYIKEHVRSAVGEAYSTRLAQRVIDKIEAETYIEQDLFFSTPPNRICVENGIIDLDKPIQDIDAEPHTPTEIHHQKIPVTYDPQADCDKIITFFREVVETEEDIKVLQEMFGFTLYKEYFMEKAFMLLGEGRNGKSKTIRILQSMLGTENTSSVSLQEISAERFKAYQLFRKLANLGSDLSSKDLKDTGMFKQSTGRDPMTADRKNLPPIQFFNYATHIFAANKLPRTSDDSLGFFNRWIFIDFPYTFLQKKELDKYTEEQKKKRKLKLQDPDRIKGLMTDEQMSGLLNWSIEGLKRLQNDKTFTSSQTAMDIKTEWIAISDSLRAFCYECLEEAPQRFVSKQDVRETYYRWCNDNGYISDKSGRSQKKTLVSMFGVDDTQKRLDEGNKRVWLGVAFKEQYESQLTRNDERSRPRKANTRVDEERVSEESHMSPVGVEELFSDRDVVDYVDVVEVLGEEGFESAIEKGDLIETKPGRVRRNK